jgi:phosphohistidine phosphatase
VRLYLVHHGDAVPPAVDPQRPLSAQGVADVNGLAAEAARRGVKPAAVWHSGKLRARQTAESFWRACNPLADFSAVRGLQPTDPASWINDRLTAETGEIMCVGHLPHIGRLFALLREGNEAAAIAFPLNGIVALQQENDRWVECWRLAPGDLPPAA